MRLTTMFYCLHVINSLMIFLLVPVWSLMEMTSVSMMSTTETNYEISSFPMFIINSDTCCMSATIWKEYQYNEIIDTSSVFLLFSEWLDTEQISCILNVVLLNLTVFFCLTGASCQLRVGYEHACQLHLAQGGRASYFVDTRVSEDSSSWTVN